ncbi:hypothetical protein I79_001167 [Cricetulus griseus]|uniref:Uncharacterized protein n=1 Tax=Cricetulus griseus TaxID=10029 RepID=G3GU20_CRIGR|nr:hypothetical protein I79_001167 [Cricetulus griseus]
MGAPRPCPHDSPKLLEELQEHRYLLLPLPIRPKPKIKRQPAIGSQGSPTVYHCKGQPWETATCGRCFKTFLPYFLS